MARGGPTIADTVLALIRERGPMTIEALTAEIVAAGRTQSRNPRAAVSAAIGAKRGFVQAWDARWCALEVQLEGAMFSTPITRLEREDEIVVVRDHLSLLERVVPWSHEPRVDADVHMDLLADFFDLPYPTDDVLTSDLREELGNDLADGLLGFLAELGLPARRDEADTLAELLWEIRHEQILHGPPGWMAPVRPGQLLGIRFAARRVETVALDPRQLKGVHVELAATRVAALARLVIGPDPSWFGPPVIALEELLELVATEAPEILRRPLPPFSEVVLRAGLEVEDGYVGHRGTNWDAWRWSEPARAGEAWGYEPLRTLH